MRIQNASTTRPTRDGGRGYPPCARGPVKQFAPSEIHFGGVCAGAYHSLKAAQKGLVARSIVVVNPLTFFWKPGPPLDAREFQVTAEAARYQRILFEPAAWIKLVRERWKSGRSCARSHGRLGTRLHHIVRELKRALDGSWRTTSPPSCA